MVQFTAHSSANLGFSTLAGRMSGGRSFVHVGAFFPRSEQLMVGPSMVFQRLYAHRNDRYSRTDVVQIGGSVLYVTAKSGACSWRLSSSTQCGVRITRYMLQDESSRSSLHEQTRMKGSLLFRFGTLLRLRIRMDPSQRWAHL